MPRKIGGLQRYAYGGMHTPNYQMGIRPPGPPGINLPPMFSVPPASVKRSSGPTGAPGGIGGDVTTGSMPSANLDSLPSIESSFGPGSVYSGVRGFTSVAPVAGIPAGLMAGMFSAMTAGAMGHGVRGLLSGLPIGIDYALENYIDPELEEGLRANIIGAVPNMPAAIVDELGLDAMLGEEEGDVGSIGPGGDPTGTGEPGGEATGSDDGGASGGAGSDDGGDDGGWRRGGLVRYAQGGQVMDDRTPFYALEASKLIHPAGTSYRQLRQMPSLMSRLAKGGKPQRLIDLLKGLPRSERYDALRENRLRPKEGSENAFYGILESPGSPVVMAGGFPDRNLKKNIAFAPRSRQMFLLYDTTRPNEQGSASELGSVVANWTGGPRSLMRKRTPAPKWAMPDDMINLDIEKDFRRQGYGREVTGLMLSNILSENDRLPLYDVKRSAKKYWESLGAQMQDPSKPFVVKDKFGYTDNLYDASKSVHRNNDYYITPGDFLESLDRFAGGGMVTSSTSAVGDQKLDLRTRAIKHMNTQIAERSAPGAAQRTSLDITRPMQSAALSPTFPGVAPWARSYLPEIRGYAEGGEVDPLLVGAGAGAAGLALRPRMINRMARPLMRAMARPAIGVESVSKSPLSPSESDARFGLARDVARLTGHRFAERPVWKGQGAWQGESGMEFNPLYVQELPRTMRRMDRSPEHMRYAAQLGESLEQQATPMWRFVPNLVNTSKDANAMMVEKIDRARLKTMAELLGPDVVTAHRPGDRAMVFPLGDQSMEDLSASINSRFNFPKIRYGRSDPGVDRVLLSREPMGFEDATYRDLGARARSPAYEALERDSLGSDAWAPLK